MLVLNRRIIIGIILFCLSFIFLEKALANEPFVIAFADSMQKIKRDGSNLSGLQFNPRVFVDVACDESESFQLIIVPNNGSLSDVKVITDQIEKDGQKLKIDWHIVGYVRTGNPSYAAEYIGWWPDPLLPAKNFKVPSDSVQPLWFTVTAPVGTKPGVYQSSITIKASGCQKKVPLTILVRNFTLPRPGALAVPFGIYMDTVANWYCGKGGRLKVEDFAKWCEFLTDYRLTPKNIGDEYVKIIHESHNEVDSVDMNDLQKTVGKLSSKLSPYAYGLYRLPSAPVIQKALSLKDANITPESVAAPVKKYYDGWKRQGFPDTVYVYGIDEPVGDEQFEFTRKTYELIKKSVPTCKIMQTGRCAEPRLVGLVDIWCPKTSIAENPFFAERLAGGDTLWAYVCVNPIPPYANFFIDEPAIDHRILFWQIKQINATGLLLWSTTWWKGLEPTAASGKTCFPELPLDMRQSQEYRRQSVHTNGDGILIYPGKNLTPLPSIRLEVIRDGIEDYEYFLILEELTAKVKKIDSYKNAKGFTLIADAEKLCKVPEFISKNFQEFSKNSQNIVERRKQIADMIEQLKNILEEKDFEKYWQKPKDYFEVME